MPINPPQPHRAPNTAFEYELDDPRGDLFARVVVSGSLTDAHRDVLDRVLGAVSAFDPEAVGFPSLGDGVHHLTAIEPVHRPATSDRTIDEVIAAFAATTSRPEQGGTAALS